MEIRALRPEDLPGLRLAFARAIGFWVGDEYDAKLGRLVDFDGSFVACDGEEIVGTLAAYRFDVSTPDGGDLPTGGTTLVGVQPTHRRRGVLRGLMEAHIRWGREREFAALGLWASETSIYSRFGYGPATRRGGWTLDLLGIDRDRTPELDLAFIDIHEAAERLSPIYDHCRSDRPGALSRSPAWWQERRLNDDPARRNGASVFQFVVASKDGEDRGYVQFRRKSIWDEARPRDLIWVEELIGDAEARRSLWTFVANMDLAATVEVFNRPVDDTIPFMFRDGRRARVHVEDALWLAPLDLPRFLSARRFAAEGALTVGLTDAGEKLRIEGGPEGVQVRRTTEAPDLELQWGDLPGLWWGDVTARALSEAGRLSGSREAILRAGHLLHVDVLPWCTERF
ncbi:MAG: GNAT family N-acetyltransferase [Myxococcota bacterium]